MTRTQKESYKIQSVTRALNLLKLYIEDGNCKSVTEISEKLEIPTSSIYRFLVVLKEAGFIAQSPSGSKYGLGVACLELGSVYLKSSSLRKQAIPLLEELRNKTSETIHLAIYDNGEVLYLEKFESLHSIGYIASRVGGRSPAYCTGLGKAMLAHLPDNQLKVYIENVSFERYTENTLTDPDELLEALIKIRECGYAIDNEEHGHGVFCIAAPIFDHKGLAGAVSISGPIERVLPEISNGEYIQFVKTTVEEITKRLGGWINE